jgi:hypothetical protein
MVFMLGNDFVEVIAARKGRCSECGGRIMVGQPILRSWKNGKTKKIVCSEKCRLDFDARVWQAIADKNEKRRMK